MRSITFSLILCSGLATAAEEPRLETLTVTASRHAKALGDHSESLSLLDEDSLNLIDHTHIQQSLARIPGANFTHNNGQEYLPSLRSPVLSGAGACGSLLTAEDGIPLRAAGFCNVNELFESHTELARRIEVIRGPAGTLYGSNAMHGVINVIGPEVAENPGGSIGIEAGPHEYARTKISANSGGGLRADLSLTHDGGYRDEAGYGLQKLSLRHGSSIGSAAVDTHLAATNLNQETAGYVEGQNAYRDRSLSRSNPNPEAYRDARALRLSTRIGFEAGQGGEMSLTPYLRKTEMAFLQHYLPGQAVEENGQRSVGIRSSYIGEFGRALQLVAGLDTEFTDGYLREFQENATEGSDFLQATIPTGRHYDYRVDAWMAAPYALLTWRTSEQLSIDMGLRYEALNYDYDNRMLAGRTGEDGTPCDFGGCRFSRPDDRADHFRNWSPKVGIIYKFDSRARVFANVAHGFRVPQAAELYRLQREQTVADLDAVEIESFELGVRGEGTKLGYELVAYAMHKENVIFRDADFFNQSNGKTAHRGVELALDYSLTKDWQLQVSASYAEHRYRDRRLLDGVSLYNKLADSAPRQFGSSRLVWRPLADIVAELEWLHQGRYYTDPQNQHSYPGHDIFNLRTQWQFDGWKLSARLINLADRTYAKRADYSSFGGDRYFPGEPRSLYLELASEW